MQFLTTSFLSWSKEWLFFSQLNFFQFLFGLSFPFFYLDFYSSFLFGFFIYLFYFYTFSIWTFVSFLYLLLFHFFFYIAVWFFILDKELFYDRCWPAGWRQWESWKSSWYQPATHGKLAFLTTMIMTEWYISAKY